MEGLAAPALAGGERCPGDGTGPFSRKASRVADVRRGSVYCTPNVATRTAVAMVPRRFGAQLHVITRAKFNVCAVWGFAERKSVTIANAVRLSPFAPRAEQFGGAATRARARAVAST